MDAWQWLEENRRLDAEHVQALGVRAIDHPKHGPGLIYPIRTRSGAVASEMFASCEGVEVWGREGNPRLLWGVDDALNPALADRPVIITEHPLDAIACQQAGHHRAVAILGGWREGNFDEATSALVAARQMLRDAPRVFVAGSPQLAYGIAAFLDPHPVSWVTHPIYGESPAEIMAKGGAGGLSGAIASAIDLDPPGGRITGFSDLPPRPERRLFRTGLSHIDRLFALEERALSVCTGIPGHGKSTFLRAALHHLALHEGVRIGAIELEGNPHKMRDHLTRLMTGRPWVDHAPERQREIAQSLDQHWRVVHRPNEITGADETLEWVRGRIQHLATVDRCKVVYVDPWNELEHHIARGESLTNYINDGVRNLRRWAERYDCHVCVVAHPKKLMPGQRPDGYSVADSAAWANKPALGFTIHQVPSGEVDGYHEHVELITWKVRDVEAYGFGSSLTRLEFDPALMAYTAAQKTQYA